MQRQELRGTGAFSQIENHIQPSSMKYNHERKMFKNANIDLIR